MQPETPQQTVNRYKNAGNDSFRSHNFADALTHYTAALDELHSLMSSGPQPNEDELRHIRSVLLSNRAATYLRLEYPLEALQDASDSSLADPTNWKSYIRASRGYEALGDLRSAVYSLMRCPVGARPTETRGATTFVGLLNGFLDKLRLVDDTDVALLGLTEPDLVCLSEFLDQEEVGGAEEILRREYLWTFAVGAFEAAVVTLIREPIAEVSNGPHAIRDMQDFRRMVGVGVLHADDPEMNVSLEDCVGVGEEEDPQLDLDLLGETDWGVCCGLWEGLLRRLSVVRGGGSGVVVPAFLAFLVGLDVLSQLVVVQRKSLQRLLQDQQFRQAEVASRTDQENVRHVAFFLSRLAAAEWSDSLLFSAVGEDNYVRPPSRIATRLVLFARIVRVWLRKAIQQDIRSRESASQRPYAHGSHVRNHASTSTYGSWRHDLFIDVHDDFKLQVAKFHLVDVSIEFSGSPRRVLDVLPVIGQEDGHGQPIELFIVLLGEIARSTDPSHVFCEPYWSKLRDILLYDFDTAVQIGANAVDGIVLRTGGRGRGREGGERTLESASVCEECVDHMSELVRIVLERPESVLDQSPTARLLSNVVLFDEDRFGQQLVAARFLDKLKSQLEKFLVLPERSAAVFQVCRLVAVLSTCQSLAYDFVKAGLPRLVLHLLHRGPSLSLSTQCSLRQAQQSILTATRLNSMRNIAAVDTVPSLRLTAEPTIDFIPSMPPSVRDIWQLTNLRQVYGLVCRTAYLSTIDAVNGMAIILHFLDMPEMPDIPMMASMGPMQFCVMTTVSFFTNNLREFGLLGPMNWDMMSGILIPMLTDTNDAAARSDPRYRLKSFVPLTTQTYLDLIETSYTITSRTRTMTEDEIMARRMIQKFYAHVTPNVRETLTDVLLEGTVPPLQTFAQVPRLTLADMRELLTYPQCRLVSLSLGDFLECGVDHPKVGIPSETTSSYRRLPVPIPKVVHNHIVTMCEIAPHSSRLMTILSRLAKFYAFYFHHYGDNCIVKEFLASAAEIDQLSRPLVEIPFVTAFMERSVYLCDSEYSSLTAAVLLELHQRLFSLDQILQHCMDKAREVLSVFDYPRIPWIEENSVRLGTWIREFKLRSPDVSPTPDEFAQQISQICRTYPEAYDPGNLERAMHGLTPNVTSFLQYVWPHLQTAPEKETRGLLEMANDVNAYHQRLRMARPGPPLMCQFCRRQATLLCQSCGRVHYCSMHCLHLDWPNHQANCQRNDEE